MGHVSELDGGDDDAEMGAVEGPEAVDCSPDDEDQVTEVGGWDGEASAEELLDTTTHGPPDEERETVTFVSPATPEAGTQRSRAARHASKGGARISNSPTDHRPQRKCAHCKRY